MNTTKEIKITKGNIPINKQLLNKYNNIEEMFSNINKFNYLIKLQFINIDLNTKNATEIYHIAIKLFKDNHKENIFVNNKNQIKVTNQDIKESINKICNDRLQNIFLKEHLIVFSYLGKIIEKAQLVNQTTESKYRFKYNTWNYYNSCIKINDILYILEFDVVSRSDRENHYRLQRLKKANTQSTLLINSEVDLGASASFNNNIT